MSQQQSQQSPSLLWINKDATNVHRKKHVAEVNAHVQKTGLNRRVVKAPVQRKRGKGKISSRAANLDKALTSPTTLSVLPQIASDNKEPTKSKSTVPLESSEPVEDPPSLETLVRSHKTPAAIIFSSYIEDAVNSTSDADADDDSRSKSSSVDIGKQLQLSLPPSIDASNPVPGLLTNLTTFDKMLLHTHLTYMPQMYYGLSNTANYCPIRISSVANMLRSTVATKWALICLEMFLETVRNSNSRNSIILQRKSQAYKLMSEALNPSSQSDAEETLLGLAPAAIAELFCGDPIKALTHLNGIDALISERGGMELVKRMELTISMPTFAILAYRTLLQDNLTTWSLFERARNTFMTAIRSFITWKNDLARMIVSENDTDQQTAPDDEGFDDTFDLTQVLEELQESRERAFVHHPILRKFVDPEFLCSRPGEKVDHFILLFSLNRAIADHGVHVKQVIQFIADIVDDVETGGSSRGEDSTINMGGILRQVTNRQVRMHLHEPGVGIARAWDALDALEIMKLFPQDMQNSIKRMLYALLIGQIAGIMTEDELLAVDSTMITEWQAKHSNFPVPSG